MSAAADEWRPRFIAKLEKMLCCQHSLWTFPFLSVTVPGAVSSAGMNRGEHRAVARMPIPALIEWAALLREGVYRSPVSGSGGRAMSTTNAVVM